MILITGASGFVGRAFCKFAHHHRIRLRALSSHHLPSTEYIYHSRYPTSDDGWSSVLKDVDCIIHLAGRAHIISDNSLDPLSEYRKSNVSFSCEIAKHAINFGIKRFIFISTVKVHGNCTHSSAFSSHDIPDPQDPYSLSKLEAENALNQLFLNTSTDFVIVRPPLIYGPDVKGYLRWIYACARFHLPLPLSCFSSNKRSILFVDNLVDFLMLCSHHPGAPGQIFLVDDGVTLSSREIIELIYFSLGSSAISLPIPSFLIRFLSTVFNCSDIYSRLCDSLFIDSKPTFQQLGWYPPFSTRTGFIISAPSHQ